MQPMMNNPRIAIVDDNTLASIGMKNLLNSIMPTIEIDSFNSFAELQASCPDKYFHYFVTLNIVLAHLEYFLEKRRKTIVMTTAANPESHLERFHSLCVSVPEKALVKSLLSLEQSAHANGHSLPATNALPHVQKALSDREIEVLRLIAKGYINKEIADRLNVSLPTIVSHRRNITEKLNRKSVSSLTIYAVMHGYVSISEI